MSLLETFLLPCLLLSFNERGIVTVVKQSLVDYPFFGKVLGATGPIAVGRQSAREDLALVLEEGAKGLQAGRSGLVFPQSTRKPSIVEDDFNSIGMKLARRAGVPAVPVALKTDFQGIGGLLRDFGRITRSRTVHFEFGAPLRVRGNGREEHDAAVRFIVGKVTSWQNQQRG
jgi:1-acyl-sn-glycerol-3-phosphate acyltransferase